MTKLDFSAKIYTNKKGELVEMFDINDLDYLSTHNILLAKLKKIDILHLINSLDNFYIPYRSKLNLPANATFGFELEYEGIPREQISRFISTYTKDYDSTRDVSLDSGGEIISPKLRDEDKTWTDLFMICQYLKDNHAVMTENAGLHISAGTHILSKDAEAWATLIETYMAFERVLIRSGFGDKLNARKSFLQYAQPVGVQLLLSRSLIEEKADLLQIKKFLWQIRQNKYNAINFRSLSFSDQEFRENTCEFRFFNATSEATIIQNNLNTIMKMFISAREKSIDRDFLRAKLSELEKDIIGEKNYINECNKIQLEDALIFTDLIFDNLFDKLCFLKQYLKGFATPPKDEIDTIMARRLVA